MKGIDLTMMKKFKNFDSVNFYLALLFSIIIYPAINLSLAFVLKKLIDAGMLGNINILKKYILICLIVCIALALSLYLSDFTRSLFIKNVSAKYRKMIFTKIINSKFTDFTKTNTSNYISNLTTNAKSVEDNYIISYFKVLSNYSLLLFSLIGMFIINWKLSIGVIIICVLPLFIMGGMGKKIQNIQKEAFKHENKYISKIKDALSGFLVVKSFQIESQINNDLSTVNEKRARSSYLMNKINAFTTAISNFGGYLIFLVAYGLGMFMILNDEITIGGVTAIVQLVNFIVMPMNILGVETNKMKTGESAAKEIDNLLDQIEDKESNNSQKYISSFSNSIQFENVFFKYNDQDNYALKNLNVTFNKGKKYAIVGASGSGKTTIFRLLLKYYNHYKGSIEIDNNSLNQLSIDSLYNLMNIVQQDVYIFEASLKYNISLGEDFTDEEILDAIHLSGLDDLLDNNSLNMQLGEDGGLISGGEKQRISIARALIRKTPILLMDEATSSLDQKTTFNIENSILNVRDLTTLTITHKLNPELLSKYDEIIFLKNGTISEIGDYKTLMNNKQDFFNLIKANNL
ncbi:ABC transporter ATP-binding protein [Staphylococcus epidermidis]|uniref:ABC transporter ATP-binding protein n=1 Tax=Staphylococcus epidermidis TaxID=1282 RepID=UPI00209362B8|nr:ABC transporter ATP-binding protein [Staphylococcus epidermidis]